MRLNRYYLAPLAMLASAGCTLGPDYHRPETDVPAEYKSGSSGSWKEGKPLDHAAKGDWWKIYDDGELNHLQNRASRANQEIKAVAARVEQARATARVARSELLPTLNANPGYTRTRLSADQTPSSRGLTAENYRAPLDLSYEIDLWSRVRRDFEGARANAQASVSALQNAMLVLHADVAQNYFAIRALDAEISIVTDAIDVRKKQTQLVGDRLDLARIKSQLESAEAEAAALRKRRAELENALAILIGENPSSFQIPAATSGNPSKRWDPAPPTIPSGLPADLLERRPDVSEAERQLAAANARIGVAKAAFFPSLSLTGSGGYVSSDLDNLFKWDNRAWSLGPSLTLPIFTGGRNQANLERSQAEYEEAVARYRQKILVAFGEVESSLSGIRFLAEQTTAQDQAVTEARLAAQLADERYRNGIVSQLEVLDANREELQTERAKAQLSGQRLIASVQLVKALGGGW
jgi:outer membrane protein, multidrug efflux system